jgi:hypothetical protein
MELNKIVDEIKDMLQDSLSKSIDPKPEDEMDNTKGCKCKGCSECMAKGGCENEMCSGHDDEEDDEEELSDEEISKSYESDNEEEDNWDNMQKACWSGFKQVGMKDKNGKKVPNCVPIKKSIFGSEGPQDLIPKNK